MLQIRAIVHYFIKHSLHHISKKYHPSLAHISRAVLYMFQVGFKIYGQDVISLVGNNIMDKLANIENGDDITT